MPKSYSIEIDDSDLDDAVNNKIPRAIGDAVRDALEEGANEIYNAARGSVPVDTGALRDSISQDVEADGFTVQASEDYAIYVEKGTSRMVAQPFFYSNADRVTTRIHTMIESNMNQKFPN